MGNYHLTFTCLFHEIMKIHISTENSNHSKLTKENLTYFSISAVTYLKALLFSYYSTEEGWKWKEHFVVDQLVNDICILFAFRSEWIRDIPSWKHTTASSDMPWSQIRGEKVIILKSYTCLKALCIIREIIIHLILQITLYTLI